MDLLSSIRKEGSRGGVNFSWDDVRTSQHRENYMGHSIMAPVGRWQKGKDLSWYAKTDDKDAVDGETAEEKAARERKEEIRRIKEAEEDALARALGLPVKERNFTGSNAISVGEVNRAVKEAGVGEDEEVDGAKGFGDFVGKIDGAAGGEQSLENPERGGLVRRNSTREGRARSRERRHKHRHRSRSPERRRHRSRSGDRRRYRHRDDDWESRRPRSRSVDRDRRRHRSRSPDRFRGKEARENRREEARTGGRSPSPRLREHRGRRDWENERRR